MLKNTPQSQCRSVKKLFSSESGFDEKIARLVVLYEDLRLETYGLTVETIPTLELIEGSTPGSSRILYFLRRATVTLTEFCSALNALDGDPDFDSIKTRSTSRDSADWNSWDDALKGLSKLVNKGSDGAKTELTKARNRMGGHVKETAVKEAISTLASEYPDLDYTIEYTVYPTPGRMHCKFHFAVHVAAAATVGELKGAEANDKVEELVQTIVKGQGYACKAMDQLAAHCLWDRFAEPAPPTPE